jgi:molecular chaperone HtpG
MTVEQYTFNAEINELMNMIIHNFYSNKDIFLRELVSNASDAINKLKYTSLQNKELLGDFYDFMIKIKVDSETKQIMIEDTGIGMDKEDLINNLGTIAKSGTKEFMKKVMNNNSTDSSDSTNTSSNLIGQFGVGFYSVYLIANSVKVITRKAGTNEIYQWESSANGSYTLSQLDSNESDIIRGTRIYLNINSESEEYLNTNKITEIIKKHSGYITYPILLHTIKSVSVPDDSIDEILDISLNESLDESIKKVILPEETVQEETVQEETVQEELIENNNELKVEDIDENDDEENIDNEDKLKQKMKTIQEESWEKINSEPLWSKSQVDITPEEYETFYKNLSGDWDKHLTLKHFKTEGNMEFSSILFIPSRAPQDLFEKKQKNNIKLYVKKVLITDDCKDLCPDWLNFISGIVDSSDLPLNASRELLQQSKIIKQISKQIVKKSIEMIEYLTTDEEKYKLFYQNFDKNIKLGIHEETSQRDKLIEFLRFNTSKGDYVSLSQYKERMSENQPGIYFITGDSIKNLENSPFVDKLKKKNWEIIYMVDSIDEYIIQHITKYKDVKLINISKDELEIPVDDNDNDIDNDDNNSELDNDTKNKLDLEQSNKLCERLKTVLGDKVDQVKISTKIESQPAIITNPMGMSANMERILKAQALSSNNQMMGMFNKRVMEINPSHSIMMKLSLFFDDETHTEEINQLVDIIYDSAMLSSGYQLDDINGYLKKVYAYMK